MDTILRSFFPVGHLLRSAVLKGGHIHQTVLMEWEDPHSRSKTVFQRINPAVFPAPELLARNNAIVANHLKSHSYPKEILHPLTTPGGDTLVWTPDGPWRAFPYLSETCSITRATDPAEVKKAAEAIGEWHAFLKDLDPAWITPAIPHFFDVSHRWGQWENAKAKALPDRMEKAAPETALLESGRHLVEKYEALKHENILPLRILHGDPKLSNLLFDEKTKEVRAIIDWDTVQPGWIVFDFGDMVRSYTNTCAEDEPDPSKVRVHQPFLDALLEGFLSQTESFLTPAERKHLPLGAQWVIWVQALRFLADYLVGDKYYPAAFAEHNLVRARGQLELWRGGNYEF